MVSFFAKFCSLILAALFLFKLLTAKGIEDATIKFFGMIFIGMISFFLFFENKIRSTRIFKEFRALTIRIISFFLK